MTFGRSVASGGQVLVPSLDDLVAEPYREENFGRARHEWADPHGSP